jgi:hypothetical protein
LDAHCFSGAMRTRPCVPEVLSIAFKMKAEFQSPSWKLVF